MILVRCVMYLYPHRRVNKIAELILRFTQLLRRRVHDTATISVDILPRGKNLLNKLSVL